MFYVSDNVCLTNPDIVNCHSKGQGCTYGSRSYVLFYVGTVTSDSLEGFR